MVRSSAPFSISVQVDLSTNVPFEILRRTTVCGCIAFELVWDGLVCAEFKSSRSAGGRAFLKRVPPLLLFALL